MAQVATEHAVREQKAKKGEGEKGKRKGEKRKSGKGLGREQAAITVSGLIKRPSGRGDIDFGRCF